MKFVLLLPVVAVLVAVVCAAPVSEEKLLFVLNFVTKGLLLECVALTLWLESKHMYHYWSKFLTPQSIK